jgi:hypothetical protein
MHAASIPFPIITGVIATMFFVRPRSLLPLALGLADRAYVASRQPPDAITFSKQQNERGSSCCAILLKNIAPSTPSV